LRDTATLEDLINTLVSNVSEGYVDARRESAAKYFYDAGSKAGLYFVEKLEDRIQRTCSAEFEEQPSEGTVSNTWHVRPPATLSS
jgi:hypothetical protein